MWSKSRLHSSPARRRPKTFQKEPRRPKTAGDVTEEHERHGIKQKEQTNRKLLIDNFMSGESGLKIKATPGKRRLAQTVSQRNILFEDSIVTEDMTANNKDMAINLAPVSTAWDSFNDYVKEINDTPLMTFASQPMNFRSSEQFKKVMDAVKPKIKQKKREHQEYINTSSVALAEAQSNMPVVLIEDEVDSESDREDNEPNPEIHRKALRGWAVIRRHVNDMKLKNKKKQCSVSWNFLRHAMTNMTDMEKARANLYDKYIYNPDTWSDGLTLIPPHVRLSRADPKVVAHHKHVKDMENREVISEQKMSELELKTWDYMLNQGCRLRQAYFRQPISKQKLLES